MNRGGQSRRARENRWVGVRRSPQPPYYAPFLFLCTAFSRSSPHSTSTRLQMEHRNAPGEPVATAIYGHEGSPRTGGVPPAPRLPGGFALHNCKAPNNLKSEAEFIKCRTPFSRFGGGTIVLARSPETGVSRSVQQETRLGSSAVQTSPAKLTSMAPLLPLRGQ